MRATPVVAAFVESIHKKHEKRCIALLEENGDCQTFSALSFHQIDKCTRPRLTSPSDVVPIERLAACATRGWPVVRDASTPGELSGACRTSKVEDILASISFRKSQVEHMTARSNL